MIDTLKTIATCAIFLSCTALFGIRLTEVAMSDPAAGLYQADTPFPLSSTPGPETIPSRAGLYAEVGQ